MVRCTSRIYCVARGEYGLWIRLPKQPTPMASSLPEKPAQNPGATADFAPTLFSTSPPLLNPPLSTFFPPESKPPSTGNFPTFNLKKWQVVPFVSGSEMTDVDQCLGSYFNIKNGCKCVWECDVRRDDTEAARDQLSGEC